MRREDLCDEKRFEAVFFQYAKDLKRYLFLKFQDLESAEDVVQETFLKLWKNCREVSPEKVRSYLFTLANNAFLDIKKHEKVVRNFAKRNDEVKFTSETPEFLMIEEEFLEKIEQAVAGLPPKQREVFVMAKIEKKKYKEIAAELGISVKAVEKRMTAALAQIREKIGYF